uniref:Ent-kaurene oxidase n=1 Tax=Leersia perrieri TaxID=77586 RepID=A0A0D9WRC9_9ORYZ
MESLLATGAGGVGAAAAAVGGLVAAAAIAVAPRNQSGNAPPAVPGLPIVGNLHQLKEKKPHQTFAKWSETYGPVYSIKTGASSIVVVNSTEVATEAIVSKFSSISTRKLPKTLSVISRDKNMVALSDYGDFHKTAKRNLMMSTLGFSAQKQFRDTRDKMVNNMLRAFHRMVTDEPKAALNFRNVFRDELYRLSLIESLGEDVSSIYVEEFGREISKLEMYNATVEDMMKCAIEVDWRDFFPYLSWVPNKSFESTVFNTVSRKDAVMRALIKKQMERIARGESRISYLDFLMEENTQLTAEELTLLVWELLVESSDTTFVSSEWAMYEIAKNPDKQERLYQEIREVCGDETVTEEHLPRMPYLNAVFHETLRRHSPVTLLPPRMVNEDITIAGYDVPPGTQEWDSPEEWLPERFLDGSYQLANMYKTLAFGGGRRVCAGARQATTIACISIARFVQEFEWRLRKGDEDKVDTVQLTTYKLQPLHVHLTPRARK